MFRLLFCIFYHILYYFNKLFMAKKYISFILFASSAIMPLDSQMKTGSYPRSAMSSARGINSELYCTSAKIWYIFSTPLVYSMREKCTCIVLARSVPIPFSSLSRMAANLLLNLLHPICGNENVQSLWWATQSRPRCTALLLPQGFQADLYCP